MPVMEKLLTVEEVAEQLQASKDFVWKLIRQKKLVAYRIEGILRIHPEDLKKYLDSKKTDQTE